MRLEMQLLLPPLPPRSDDALWALDGLASGSAATCRDSLAALAEICAARRGRLALRSGNLAADVLGAAGAAPLLGRLPPALPSLRKRGRRGRSRASNAWARNLLAWGAERGPSCAASPPRWLTIPRCSALPSSSHPLFPWSLRSLSPVAGALKVQEDPVQALGLATLLLCFCQADADAALLGRREVAGGAAALLRVRCAGAAPAVLFLGLLAPLSRACLHSLGRPLVVSWMFWLVLWCLYLLCCTPPPPRSP
jgi:hypothetical protein